MAVAGWKNSRAGSQAFRAASSRKLAFRRCLSAQTCLDQIPEHQQGDEAQQDIVERADIMKIFHGASPSPGGRDSVLARRKLCFTRLRHPARGVGYRRGPPLPPVMRSPETKCNTLSRTAQIAISASSFNVVAVGSLFSRPPIFWPKCDYFRSAILRMRLRTMRARLRVR